MHQRVTNKQNDQASAKAILATLHPHAATAFEALSVAGAIVREAYARTTDEAFDRKGHGDLVTETDKRAEAAALRVLRVTTPDFAVIAEESLHGNVSREKPTWVLDPLDGTAAFIFRTKPEHPAVMLALHIDGAYDLAMVFRPLVDEWYVAVRGKGAYSFRAPDRLVRLGDRHNNGSLSTGWVALNWYGDAAQQGDILSKLISRLRGAGGPQLVTVEAPHSSLGCDVVRSARPRAVVHDNNPHKIKQAEWDVAPIRLLVEEAGGVFMDFNGHRYLRPEQGPIVVAASPAVGGELMALQSDRPGQAQLLEVVRPDVEALHQFFLTHGANEWNYLPPDELREHLNKTHSGAVRAVTAYQSGALVGVATYEVGDFYPQYRSVAGAAKIAGYVSEVTVHREHQGRGLGAKLLTYVADILRAEGVQDVFAKRHEQNLGSEGMMRKSGFQLCDVFPDPIRTSGSRRTAVERL